MKLLLFSDIHSDFPGAAKLVELSRMADVVVGAGDYCLARRGLDEIIAALSAISNLRYSYRETPNLIKNWSRPAARGQMRMCCTAIRPPLMMSRFTASAAAYR